MPTRQEDKRPKYAKGVEVSDIMLTRVVGLFGFVAIVFMLVALAPLLNLEISISFESENSVTGYATNAMNTAFSAGCYDGDIQDFFEQFKTYYRVENIVDFKLDYCEDKVTLVEGTCSRGQYGGTYLAKRVECPYGCMNGACII